MMREEAVQSCPVKSVSALAAERDQTGKPRAPRIGIDDVRSPGHDILFRLYPRGRTD